MNTLPVTAANEIWKKLTDGRHSQKFTPKPEVYQQLLHLFMPGDYYYYIINLSDMTFDYLSDEIEHVLMYSKDEIDVPLMISIIHPEDQHWFLNFENTVADFFLKLNSDQIPKYKVSYDYRIKKKDGSYIRILQQVTTIQTLDGRVVRTFGVHTDITHLKPFGKPTLSFIGLNGEPSYLNVEIEKKFIANNNGLTARENAILHMLSQGKISEQIATELFISVHTVNTHRRNILNKTNTRNITELLKLAIKNGWV